MVCGKGSKRASLMSSSPRRDDSVLRISRQCRCNNMGFGSGLRKQLGSLKTKRTTNAVVSAWERERTGQGGGSSGEGDGSVFSNKVFRATAGFVASTLLGFSLYGAPAEARLEGVNKPELLPKEYSPLIDVADFLTSGEEERVIKTLERLEKDTGVKLRVLAQNYPETPGLAIKEFWKVDSNTVVLVADPNTGNITNFNVGDDVDFQVPRNFWSKVAGKFGNKFYWRDEGPDRAIINSVNAIDFCLREPESRFKCTQLNSLEEEF